MIALRAASVVLAVITLSLNAAYGFKTSNVLAYAVLFAALNATLDIAKSACLVVASRAWANGRPLAAILLFLLFWPLLANSLWCGLSEVAFNRTSEQTKFTANTDDRTRAAADHKRTSEELEDLQANRIYKATAACALPKTNRDRTFCARHEQAQQALAQHAALLSATPTTDPAPQITLLADWTGFDLSLLALAIALWPIALAELCSSVGFYLSATPHPARTKPLLRRFWSGSAMKAPSTDQTEPQPRASAPTTDTVRATVRWPTIAKA